MTQSDVGNFPSSHARGAFITEGTGMNAITVVPEARSERSGSASDGVLPDYRERRVIEALERAELKRVILAEQHAPDTSADVRIRAWEKVHQLRMPSDPFHPALHAIAAATHLTLEDVRNEQQLRSSRRASASG